MDRRTLVIGPGDYPPPLKVVGTDVTVLASREDTAGQEFTYQSGGQGMGPPPHSHAWDEAFFVVQGSVEFTCDGQTRSCLPGTLVFVPGGTVHAFQYGPQGGAMLELTGTNSEAAQLFTTLHNECPPGPPDVEKIVELMGKNGVTVQL